MKTYKYLTLISILFVAILMISNTVAIKQIQIFGLFLDGGTLLFPLSYIFGDILTEVYGYGEDRKVIWYGFIASIVMAFNYWIVSILPSTSDSFSLDVSNAFNLVLAPAPRIVLASLVAYFFGSFVNSYIVAKMKIFQKGKRLYQRTISSTIIGQIFDTAIFITLAFGGVFDWPRIGVMIVSIYLFKVAIEILFTPVTYQLISFLKKQEGVDQFDNHTDFNLFGSNSSQLAAL
jgi:queuosine precursor transporter